MAGPVGQFQNVDGRSFLAIRSPRLGSTGRSRSWGKTQVDRWPLGLTAEELNVCLCRRDDLEAKKWHLWIGFLQGGPLLERIEGEGVGGRFCLDRLDD